MDIAIGIVLIIAGLIKLAYSEKPYLYGGSQGWSLTSIAISLFIIACGILFLLGKVEPTS